MEIHFYDDKATIPDSELPAFYGWVDTIRAINMCNNNFDKDSVIKKLIDIYNEKFLKY